MNADLRALLGAVLAAPADDLPRLVLADWLDEHGRPDRAEFIRVECGIAHTTPGQPRRAALFGRRAELFRAHAADWFARFVGTGAEWETGRGFVAAVTADPPTFLAHADRWFAAQPIDRLTFPHLAAGPVGDRRWFAKELLTSPHLARVGVLTLDAAGLNAAGVYWLSCNRHLAHLRELSARENRVDDAGAATLAGMPALAGLRALDLSDNRLTDAGLRALADSPHLAELTELRVAGNRFTRAGWAAVRDRFGPALLG